MEKINIYFFESLPSTNSYAKENISALSLPALILANGQTNGRGRQGNSFFSPSDTGLYMTAVFPAPSDCGLLTPLAAVSVCESLEKYGIEPKIKWVNDVFVNTKKICGILTELFTYGKNQYIALGVGINLTTKVFPSELSQAGSAEIKCNKKQLALDILNRIFYYIKKNNCTPIIENYRSRLFILGKQITYSKNGICYSATVTDINSQCNLIVKRADGTEDTLSSGEISIKI